MSIRIRQLGPITLPLALALSSIGCSGGSAPDGGPEEDAAVEPSRDAGPADQGTGDRDAGPPPLCERPPTNVGDCGPIEDRPILDVNNDITEDTVWSCRNIYILNDVIYVRQPDDALPEDPRTQLTIEPGTIIRGVSGDNDVSPPVFPGALVVTRTGLLDAEGTREQPILFTSNRLPGDRRPGDWGGVVLLGRGTNNLATGEQNVEGLLTDERSEYGAPVGEQDPDWDCGTLRFARIEFVGFDLSGMNELNALTIGSCGTGTTIDHVQVHMGLDDGVELFGGSVDLSHIVTTAITDDNLDWDLGYSGRVQFLAVQQLPGSLTGEDPDHGFESDSGLDENGEPRQPQSAPRLFNLTLIGEASGEGVGMDLDSGTTPFIANAVVTSFGAGQLDIASTPTANAARSGELVIQSSIFFAGDSDFNLNPSQDDEDDGFGEEVFGSMFGNRTVDPRLTPSGTFCPLWIPGPDSPLADGAVAPSEADGDPRRPFFDTGATYVGAFEPGGDDWTLPWAAYPLD